MKLCLPKHNFFVANANHKTNLNRLVLICFCYLLSTLSLMAQSVTLANQNEVNNFPATTTHITGTLNIGGSFSMSDIMDLSPLSNIQKIDGDLNITFNGDLTTLNGLTNIQSIGGRVFITNNPKLRDCIALVNFINSGLPVINDNLTGCNSAAEIIKASQPAVAVVPTFSQWGLFVFGLIVLNLGLFFMNYKVLKV